jgi:phosphoribosylformylglycinamidine cyclo-ligase
LSKHSIKDKIKGVGTLGDALLTPTEIYVKPILEILENCDIHGLAHITGGSFTKLLRLKKTGYLLDNMPEPPEIFQMIENENVEKSEMYKTFNMGIGFCIIAPEEEGEQIEEIFKKHRLKSRQIGSIIEKRGVFIDSLKIA